MQNHYTALSGDTTAGKDITSLGKRIWAVLMGEERPRDMLLLFMLLVLMLHVWLLTVLMKPEEKITQAEPLVMEVSMIAMSAPKPAVQPPKPAPAPPPPEKKPLPPKPKPKPVVKKPAPVVQQEAQDFAPSEPAPTPPQNTQSTSADNTATASSSSQAADANNAPTFTEANFRANYAHNPKPNYPAIARSRSWQGKVMLRVKVSAQGSSDGVTVEQSSGHEILDEAAIEAVTKWRFIPAKRGDTPVASSVIVPIDFKLRN